VRCSLVSRLIDETPLILGSGSPRRERILRSLGLEFEIDVPGVEEVVLPGESPREHVLRLAREKAADVVAGRGRGTVLAADTVVFIEGRILGKPNDAADAARMLRETRGRWHDVFTGLRIVRASDGTGAEGLEVTRVLMRDLSDADVDLYVGSGEPLDKAGSYAIQDCGSAVVERVEGCFYNVVGLPVVRMCRVLEELRGGR